jgi:hypothetical protein
MEMQRSAALNRERNTLGSLSDGLERETTGPEQLFKGAARIRR